MTNSPIQPAGKRGATTGHSPTLPVAPSPSGKGARKSGVGTAAPTPAREAAPTETLRLLGKIEEHVGKLRTAIERPTRGAKDPATVRSAKGPTAHSQTKMKR